jgi:hypothetical protein
LNEDQKTCGLYRRRNHQYAPAAEPPVNNRTGNSGCRSARGQFSLNAEKAVLFSGTNGRRFSSFRCGLALAGRDQVDMKKPPEIEIVRKAYELWEQSGKPEGRDQDFYLQALQELQTLPGNNAAGEDE